MANKMTVPNNFYETWGDPRLTRVYAGDSNPGLGGRLGGAIITGQVMGGSSAINIGAYTRPEPKFFDDIDLPGWSYDDILPIFKNFIKIYMIQKLKKQ